MRVQGALRSFTSILNEAASHPPLDDPNGTTSHHESSTPVSTKLDIMETICKLLFRNAANQIEFRKLDGYSVLLRVFDEIVIATGEAAQEKPSATVNNGLPEEDGECVGSPELQQPGTTSSTTTATASARTTILQDCFNIIYTVTLDGSPTNVLQNLDSLFFLFRTLTESTRLDVRKYALNCIQDLVTLNGLNAVAAWKCGGIDCLVSVIRTALRAVEGRDGVGVKKAQWIIGTELVRSSRRPTCLSLRS